MRDKAATEGEFHLEENAITHVPTNAHLCAHPGRIEINSYNHLGSVLPNGDDYDEESVWRIARHLLTDARWNGTARSATPASRSVKA